ncbi:hypothetical protein UXN85_20740 [Enterobacter hormaechei]
MMKMLFIMAALICAPLASHADMPRTLCDEAADTSYEFIENIFKTRPEIAYSPVRTDTDTQLLRLSCLNGFNHGVKQDAAEMNMMFNQLRIRARKKNVSVEEARYLISDMSMALAYKAGYLAGVN